MLTRESLGLPDRNKLRSTNNRDNNSSSSDDDDKDQDNKMELQNSIDIIDLTTSDYVPRTLRQPDNPRHSILPAFPTSIKDKHPPALLLANVPYNKLDSTQRIRRQRGHYPLIYSIDKNKSDIPSYFRDHYHSFIQSLVRQFRIDESIIDYNLYRFSECFKLFANDLIRQHHQAADYFQLDDQQKRYAFEFYLQIDVDLFFMKTCSFRQAKPRSTHESLFCVNEPYSKYCFTACNNCRLCCLRYNPSCRETSGPAIQFDCPNGFTFKNGYKTLLNCPANCNTNNIIYVLKCPCNQFEYIGETSQRLYDRLKYHRQQLNRIFHEFLLGEKNIQNNNNQQQKDKQTLTKDRMVLYRHTVRCPSAMQIFLNFNPIYWCFVPLRHGEVDIQDQNNPTLPQGLTLLDSFYPTSIASKDRNAIMATQTTRSDESVRSCIRNLPSIPQGYEFSIQQRAQQFQYFKQKHDLTHVQNPTLDLYNAAVIAVLPEDVSETVRRFIESLFITHTEAKLNTSGRLVESFTENDAVRTDIPYDLAIGCSPKSDIAIEIELMDREEWCMDLIFPHHRPYMNANK